MVANTQALMARGIVRVVIAILPWWIAGCAPKPLYYWGRYETLLYEMYAKPGQADPATQIAQLSEDIERAQANGQRVPPGVHAHLGYMQFLSGDLAKARAEFETEKRLYSESATFMDRLIGRMPN